MDVLEAYFYGAFTSVFLISLVYIVGKFLKNTKLIAFAFAEMENMWFSLFIAGVFIFLFELVANSNVSSLPQFMVPSSPSVSSLTVYKGSEEVLSRVAVSLHAALIDLRNMAAFLEKITRFSRQYCENAIECFLMVSPASYNTYAGYSVFLSSTYSGINMLLYAYFSVSVLFLFFHIGPSFLSEILPFAIIFRSFSATKQFGSLLLGYLFSIYIFLPLMGLVLGKVFGGDSLNFYTSSWPLDLSAGVEASITGEHLPKVDGNEIDEDEIIHTFIEVGKAGGVGVIFSTVLIASGIAAAVGFSRFFEVTLDLQRLLQMI